MEVTSEGRWRKNAKMRACSRKITSRDFILSTSETPWCSLRIAKAYLLETFKVFTPLNLEWMKVSKNKSIAILSHTHFMWKSVEGFWNCIHHQRRKGKCGLLGLSISSNLPKSSNRYIRMILKRKRKNKKRPNKNSGRSLSEKIPNLAWDLDRVPCLQQNQGEKILLQCPGSRLSKKVK